VTAASHRPSSSRPFTLTQRLTLAIAPRFVWILLSILGRTWRFEVLAEDGVTPAFHGFSPSREIYCFWHQCVLACAFYYRSTHATILISQSFDGELITRTLECFGYRAVRGSSSRGGREGLLALRRTLDQGTPAIFTADGPRGPIYQSKAGPIKLAQISQAPIGCFHLEPERAWTMRSWDRFQIPKPFTRIAVSWGHWNRVREDADETTQHHLRLELDNSLNRARHRAYDHLGKTAETNPEA